MIGKVEAVLVGGVREFGPGGEPSAIGKQSTAHPVRLTARGLAGDEHGDTRNHGGPEKALHQFASEHYAHWQAMFPERPDLFRQLGFLGENIATSGMTEQTVCVGDVYRIGEAVVEVSQARQPCWKLTYRTRIPDFAMRMQLEARTGWHYRVLEEGEIRPGDSIVLLHRSHPDWPLVRLLAATFLEPLDTPLLEAMTGLTALAVDWKAMIQRRLDSGQVESWEHRLYGPLEMHRG